MAKTTPGKKWFDFELFGRVLMYAQPYRWRMIWSLVLALLLGVISPLRGILIQYTVDKGIKNNINNLPAWLNNWFDRITAGDIASFLILITAIQVVVLLVETAMRLSFSYITSWLGQHVVNDMRKAVFKKVLSLRLRQFDRTPIGTLTTRTINDIESINEIFSDGLIPIIADVLTIVFTLGAMFYIDWQLTLISLIPFPFLLFATYVFKESVNRSFIKVRNAVSALNAFVQEHITGMHVVQAFVAEDRQMRKFSGINRQHRQANVRAIFAYSVFFPVVEVVLALSTGLLVWWVAGQRIDAGKLIAFILFLNQIFRPLRIIADKFNVIQMGMVASERVFKVLDNPDVMPEKAEDAGLKRFEGKIVFEDVSFEYEANNRVLHDINLQVAAGETLALVGNTGSGKTTITALLNRLYDDYSGTIKIDGTDIKNIPLNQLRRQVGVVLQDVFLFSGSILQNITLGDDTVPFERVMDVSRQLGAHDFIMRLPGGYDFNVMERGHTLSAGQRQLISFCRCLIYNPAILILDEATSNIDSETEALIQEAIARLVKGRTSIVVAHRLSTIRQASRIVLLEKGRVVESGTHEELLGLQGAYSKLYYLQYAKAAPLNTVALT